jgi:hypothetical protein
MRPLSICTTETLIIPRNDSLSEGVAYLSMGVSAIAAGVLVARHGNILGTGKEFGVVVMTVALAAVLAAALRMATSRAAIAGR